MLEIAAADDCVDAVPRLLTTQLAPRRPLLNLDVRPGGPVGRRADRGGRPAGGADPGSPPGGGGGVHRDRGFAGGRELRRARVPRADAVGGWRVRPGCDPCVCRLHPGGAARRVGEEPQGAGGR